LIQSEGTNLKNTYKKNIKELNLHLWRQVPIRNSVC